MKARYSDCKLEGPLGDGVLIKTDNANSFSGNSGCPNVSKLSFENKKRNKYRMLGTDLKRKAVYLVSQFDNNICRRRRRGLVTAASFTRCHLSRSSVG